MRPAKPQLEPVVETRRLILRPLRTGDLDDVVAGIGDFAVSRMLARVPYPYSKADAEAFLAVAQRDARMGLGLVLAIEHGGKLIGGISIDNIPRVCELGYWIARSHWGHGYGTEASRATLDYGFEVLGLRLIRSGYFAENAGSRRVQQKLGFRPIGAGRRLSLAQGTEVAHIDTVLTPARFRHAF